MTVSAWAAFALLACAALGLTFWLYLRREPPGRGRLLLAALRGGALLVVLVLLFDPELPARGRRAAAGPIVLLDASASMALPATAGGAPETSVRAASRWSTALPRARERAGGRPVLLFGAATRPIDPDSLLDVAPADARSLLIPALQAAAEAGARRVVVFTDGGIEDAASLPAWLPRLGLEVTWERVGEPLPGAGLLAVTAPAWAPAGEPVDLQVIVGSSGGGAPERTVVVRQGSAVLGSAQVATPAAGRVSRVTLSVRPSAPPSGDEVRLDVALEPEDVVAADDHRVVLVTMSADPAGIVLVSLRPDWEPRFLLPVLQRTLGLPTRGFLHAAPGVWVRLGDGADAGRRVAEGDVARAVADADLLVVHGAAAEVPPWLGPALANARATLVFGGAAGARAPGLAIAVPPPVVGDWFAAADVPPSPVAALLAGVPVGEVPPLDALAPVALPEGAWAPLLARRGPGGPAHPLVVAGRDGPRRWAVGLGQGYWRWAFREGEPRELYERLWSALGGWLVAGQSGAVRAPVRPVPRVLTRGERAAWVAAGLAPDSIRLRARSGAGMAIDTVLVRAASDSLPGPRLAPGTWRWQATAYAAADSVSGTGELYVEEFSAELVRPVAALEDLRAPEPVGGQGAARAGSTPLHATAFPYLLIVLLLAAEWVLRRRWGLR